MKPLIYFILLSILLSCSKTSLNKICDVDDPITELNWLADEIDNGTITIVDKVVLKNKNSNKKQKALSIVKSSSWGYYNCSGEILYISIGVNPASNPFKVIKSEEIYRKY